MAKAKDTQASVLWWMGWMALTILTFFVAAWFWTPVVAKHFGPMQKPWAPAVWTGAVFGTWMLFLVPLIVVMYNKVDRAYEDARIAREREAFDRARKGFSFRSTKLEDSRRVLSKEASKKLKNVPETVKKGYEFKGHLVTAVLRDGRRVENVFILDREELLGVYDRETVDFDATDVVDMIPTDLEGIPVFKAEKWLRLDGVSVPTA